MLPTVASAKSPEWDTALDQAVGYLQQYLRIDTSNPPGDVTKAAAFLTGILRKAGINHEVFIADEAAGKVNVLARLPAKGKARAKPILLLNHMDVVPVEMERWQPRDPPAFLRKQEGGSGTESWKSRSRDFSGQDPFGGEIVDDAIWGRGALDMKHMGIAGLMTLIRLKQDGVKLSRDVLWLAVCDEEIGGTMGAKWMAEHHYALMDPEFVIDEGGSGSRGLLSPDARTVFAPSVSEKQVVWLKLVARGTGGHGSMPTGDNPVEILQQALARLMARRAELEEAGDHPIVSEMRAKLGALADNRYTNAITKNTITLTSFQAGVGTPPKVNVIPSEAAATLDCRLLPGGSVPDFLARLKQVLGDERVSVEVTYQPAEPTVEATSDTALFRAIEEVVKQFYPQAVVVPSLLPGGTDSRFFRAKGAIAYGFEPLILAPEDLDLIHGHNERIDVEQFRLMVRMLYEIVTRVARTPSG
ncbi:MAG: M20/M25/M40 family metallo-hydrolase [Candidatus Omnitrophica bacterium]|nr:M20/M25/M40 family metallo-hydrolase [Candidatus Omnitrophota bacterium]